MEDFRQVELKALRERLTWYDLFVDYIQTIDHNMYNDACKYADKN